MKAKQSQLFPGSPNPELCPAPAPEISTGSLLPKIIFSVTPEGEVPLSRPEERVRPSLVGSITVCTKFKLSLRSSAPNCCHFASLVASQNLSCACRAQHQHPQGFLCQYPQYLILVLCWWPRASTAPAGGLDPPALFRNVLSGLSILPGALKMEPFVVLVWNREMFFIPGISSSDSSLHEIPGNDKSPAGTHRPTQISSFLSLL